MNLSERILRIATSHWTERSCFALTLAAALTGDGRMWIAAVNWWRSYIVPIP